MYNTPTSMFRKENNKVHIVNLFVAERRDGNLTNLTCQIAPGVWTIMTYEDSWKSFINNYVLERDGRFYLVDSNLRKHRPYFQSALKEIGVSDDNVQDVLYTHRLADHIGNVELFSTSQNWIHLHDFFELDDYSQSLFGHSFAGEQGRVGFFQFKNLPTYTEGSVAYYDDKTKVCFIGDHLHFFGVPVDQVVGYQEHGRSELLNSLTTWLHNNPSRDEVRGFMDATRSLNDWPIEILATGHGPILQGDVQVFLKDVVQLLGTYVDDK
ncbi:MBL fold metallo-hydrolase [Brevibacillus daliensis]|uniref:MBL fold metallo-hydrolase n=1 Tax=Brevibacillus daliensis TaxID=2892995 RepID=UPI001E5133CC|nr:MBL fold metallo-hydrolase [Brevibacillus daliensis]